ncbi:MAG TPA: hypothetical protein VD968_10450, partial [Pyrinomonadaceae bacterium]|nr:hypothetical protein [Pyrinomonadaceae bacterium]
GAGRPVRAAVLIALAVLLAAGGLTFLIYRFVLPGHVEPRRQAGFQTMKITRLPVAGTVVTAAVSPDGQYLAYVINENGSASVWVRQVAAASNSQRIVEPSPGVFYFGVTFSPDSSHVYFASVRDGVQQAPSLFRVPVLGGATKKILDELSSPVSFSRDGKQMTFIRGQVMTGTSLVVAPAEGGGEERTLARGKPGSPLVLPAWSPDGDKIACVFASTSNYEVGNPNMGVTSFDVATGAETRLTDERWFNINAMAWLPDGGLVLSAAEQELSPQQIWGLLYPRAKSAA